MARLFRRVLLLLGVLTFFSCGGGRREVKIALALLPSEQAKYAAVIDTFSARSGIEVRLVAQQYAEIRSAVEAEAKAGRGELDLVELDVYLLPLMQKFMQPLDTLVAGISELAKSVRRENWNVGVFDGKTYFVPHRLNWQAMFYDASALGAPPASWEELLALAKRHPGRIGLKCARYEGLVCDIFPFLWQAGADPLKPSSQQAREALRFLQELAKYLNPAARSYKENTVLQAQEHGEVLLHFNWPFAVPLLREKGLLPSRVRTAPLPAGPRGRATVLGGGYLAIPKTAPHPDLAAKFIEFVTSPDGQRMLVSRLGWFPIRDEGWAAMTDDDKAALEGFLAMKDAVFARPNIPSYPEVSRIWQDGFYRIAFGGACVDSVVEEMQRRIDSLIASR